MKKFNENNVIKEYSAKSIIEILGPYITEKRKERINTTISGRIKDIQLAIESPSDINNALAAVRSSEAFGISKVHIIKPEGKAMAANQITQGAIHWMEILFYESLEEFLQNTNGVILAGGVVNSSTKLSEIPVEKPLCILIGNEHRGLSQEALSNCKVQYTIPMYGMTESFNLSVSAAISIYDTTQRKRKLIASNTDLNTSEQELLRAQFYLNSTSNRLKESILKKSYK